MALRTFAILAAVAFGTWRGLPAAAEPWDGAAFAGDPARMLKAAVPRPEEEMASAVVLLEEESHSFDSAGRDTQRRRQVVRIASPAGIDDWSSLEETWSPWFEERPILKARVISADGAVHTLDPATITEGPAETSSKLYSDQKILRAPLPAVAVGAVVETETVVRERSPDFDAGRVFVYQPPVDDPVREARLTVEAPPSIPLRHVERLLPGLEMGCSEAGGLVRLTFRAGPLEPVATPEPDLPPESVQWPRVAFSTGRSWKDVAVRYGEIVEEQIAGADLRAAAEEAFGGKSDRGEIIARALAWIHRQIRYTGVELGEASIVPRRPREVLERKYGDCKDQVALAIALLREGKVPAHAALLRMGPDPDIDPQLPGFDFDHVILHLPGPPEMWIDPTEEYARPGELPLVDQGRLALVVAPQTEAPTRTPIAPAQDNSIVSDREILLSEAGPARVIETIEARGSFEVDRRSRYHETDRRTLRESLEKYIRKTYQSKALDRWEFTDPLDLSTPFQLHLEASAAANGLSDGTEATVTIKLGKIAGELCSTVTGKHDGEAEADREDTEEPEAKKRTNDYLMDPPHVVTWRYRISPPPGFAVRELPRREEIPMGPARLTKEYNVRPDGVVEATFTFDTVKTRVPPKEFEALRDGVQALAKAEPVKLRFRSIGEDRLTAGRTPEALAEFRKLRDLHPDEALHHRQLARALLQGGLGEAAREEARRAVEIEPGSADAQRALGSTLECDALGRRWKPGFDRAGALECYQKAKEIDPARAEFRAALAFLLERDEEGVRFSPRAQLAEALAELQYLRDELHLKDYDPDLLTILFRMERLEEAKSLARSLKDSTVGQHILIASLAATDGVEKAIEEARQLDPRAPERTVLLDGAATQLALLRRYPQAADLIREASGESGPKKLRGREEALRKLRRHEEVSGSGDGPFQVVRDFYTAVILSRGDREKFKPFLSARLAQRDDFAGAFYRGIAHNIHQQKALEALPLDWVIDSIPAMEISVLGEQPSGLHLEAKGPGFEGAIYLERDGGQCRFLADRSVLNELGGEALRRLEAGDLPGARLWLDWARKEIKTKDGEDPYRGSAFPIFWTAGSPAGMDEVRIAAAALLAQGKPCEEAIPILRSARETASSEKQKSRLDLALALALHSKEHAADLLSLAERMMKEQPQSTGAFRIRHQALYWLKRDSEIKPLAKERLGRIPGDKWAILALSDAEAEAGNFQQAQEVAARLDKAGAEECAWFSALSLALGGKDESAVNLASRAVERSGGVEPLYLRLLAAVRTEAGQTTEALAALGEEVDLRDDRRPAPEDWYILARLAERYGENGWARTYHARVPAPKPDDHFSEAIYGRLAAKRLEALGAEKK